MKTAIAWRYRTKTSLAPKRGCASCESKKCLPKGRQRAFHLLLKVSCIEEMLEAPRAGGPVRVGETLLPLTLPHEGGRGEQRTRSNQLCVTVCGKSRTKTLNLLQLQPL